MTDHSPQHWAAANLVPVSPSPVHPPSPIIVPTLQDQADTYSSMPLTSGDSSASAVGAGTAAASINNQTAVQPFTVRNNPSISVSNTGSIDLESTNQDRAVNGASEKAENVQDPETSQPDAIKTEQDVCKSNKSTPNSDAATPVSYHVDATVPAHENGTSSLQILSDPVPAPPSDFMQKPVHQWPRHNHFSSSTHVSDVDDIQRSQVASEQSPTNYQDPSTISRVDPRVSDLQALVDNITARAANADTTHIPGSEGTSIGKVVSQSTILPPKPLMPKATSTQPYLSADKPSFVPEASQSSVMHLPPSNGTAPGTYADAAPNTVSPYASAMAMPPGIPVPNHAISTTQSGSTYRVSAADEPARPSRQEQQWETFLREERNYVSEAKWDRFPEGSRIFIGNLSSDRVSKREVFEIFSKFGRLAQISLKQAYGFVQYHTIAEGKAAMDNLQGMDIKGKKINLEFSRTQKRDGEGHRGNRGKRENDRQENNRGRRDDYRPARQHSPRRSNHRQQPSHDGNNRGRGHRESSYSSDRRRSQSPGYGGRDLYRRRSPSPNRRHTSAGDIDIPYRHGREVPDVQFLLLQDVKRDFVNWVQAAFVNQGLRVDIMFLNPRFPRDAVIQRQVIEGVHAVVELDLRAQAHGKIPLQVFDRSAGYNNVRFDQYQDLEPMVAAQLVTRVKSQTQGPAPPYRGGQYPLPQQHAPPQQHRVPHQYPPPQHQPHTQGQYAPPSYPNQQFSLPAAPGAGGAPLDTAAVNKILGTLNGQQSGPHTYTGGRSVDVNTLLATLGTAPQGAGAPLTTQRGAGYAHPPHNGPPGPPPAGSSAQHVEDIMAQLAKYRQ